jgi:SAM-dependent methyltransferase
MSELSRMNPTGRFTGLAQVYAKYRPTYPNEAVDFILSRCGLRPGSVLVDVGCGTGISSRLFASRGLQVIGVEPNVEMRAVAEAEAVLADYPRPIYRDGRAEGTGFPPHSADAVLCAQAFHWFEPGPALREFHRILKPGGWVILLWNERDESDPFTAAYSAVFRSARDTAAVERPRGRAGKPLLKSTRFENAERVIFRNAQRLDEDGLIGRALSASYAPREPDQAAPFTSALRAVFSRYQQQGTVVLRYETSAYLGQRRADHPKQRYMRKM